MNLEQFHSFKLTHIGFLNREQFPSFKLTHIGFLNPEQFPNFKLTHISFLKKGKMNFDRKNAGRQVYRAKKKRKQGRKKIRKMM